VGGTPAAGYFASIAATTGTIATSPSADTGIRQQILMSILSAQGLDIKASCLYGTTNNITLFGLGSSGWRRSDTLA